MTKKLILMNGRGDYGRFDGYLYVAAYSKADAIRLLKEAGYERMTLGELNKYWSKGAWGVTMDGITPERGIWFVPKDQQYNREFRPERIL